MAKKITMMLAAAMAITGIVSAQTPPLPTPNPTGVPGAGAGFSGLDFGMSALPSYGLSTAARNSAGVFGSAADDFIDTRSYSSGPGTFLFAGVDSAPSDGRYVNLGLARSLGPVYLGVYYGGGIGNASGSSEDAYITGNLPQLDQSRADWRNNLAVLVGIAGMGLRLDATFNSSMGKYSQDWADVGSNDGYYLTYSEITDAPSLSLTWGAAFGSLSPWVRVGYKFADTYEVTEGDSTYGYKGIFTGGSNLEAAAGTGFTLDGASSLGAALRFGLTTPETETYTGTWPVGSPHDDFSNTRYGSMGFGLETYYSRNITVGIVEIGLKPYINAGLTHKSNDWDGGTVKWVSPWDRWISVEGGTSIGIKMQVGEKFAFYSGANLRLCDWTYWQEFGGDDANPARLSAWRISGVDVTDLGLGLTATPAENVEVGIGLGSLLGLGNPKLELTVSARLGGGSNRQVEAATQTPAAAAQLPAEAVGEVTE